MRVMFVDDEQKVLDGIERSLFALDRDWDVESASSGAAALHRLTEKSFDVVVSDMRMPCMNGHELLVEVRRRSPETLRIILSGFSEEEAALRALDVVHRFLPKPTDAQVLVETIERIHTLRQRLASPTLARFVGGIDKIPHSPRVYNQIMQQTVTSDADAKTIARIVNQDPVLAAKVLQVANSAFFCRAKPVADITMAITHVGLDTLRALVLLSEVCGDSDARSTALRESSLRAMRIAEHVASGNREAFEGTTAALLCEIALLIPDLEQQCALADARGEGRFGYAEIGAYLLGTWGLPMAVVEAVAFHASPSTGTAASTFGATGIAHVASMLSSSRMPDMVYLERCGVAARLDDWSNAAARIRGKVS